MARLSRRQFLWLTGSVAGASLLGGTPQRLSALSKLSSPARASTAVAGILHARVTMGANELALGILDQVRLVGDVLRPGPSTEGRCRSPVFVAPFPFNAIGLLWEQVTGEGEIALALRVSFDGLQWSDWQPVIPAGAQLGNGALVVHGSLAGLFSDPLPRFGQCEITLRRSPDGRTPSLRSLTLGFIDSGAGPSAVEALANTTTAPSVPALPAKPPVISRTAWGCPDGQVSPGWPPEYRSATHLFVHHTATANNQSNWASVVRAVWTYHALTLDWGDTGYSYLVDPNGYLYEGRAGGDDVVAGHTYGFNIGTLGLACLGTYSSYSPPAPMLSAAASLLAWKSGQRCIDPTASRSFVAYPSCSSATMVIPTVLGHRDAPGHGSYDACNLYGPTSCPGDALSGLIPSIRSDIRDRLLAGSSEIAVSPATFAPTTILAGALLRIDATVVNNTCATIPTQGPQPGAIYEEGDSYKTLYPEVAGCFRVAVDYAGRTQAEDHPYRWGLPGSLPPGASTTVTGYIRLRSARATNYWVGLIQELTRWWQDGVATTAITVVAVPQVAIHPVSTDKTWFILSWEGNGGAGALTYTLDVSADGSTWQRWFAATSATHALFAGAPNHNYYFRATATDSAGNVGPASQISVRTGADSTGLSRTNLPPVAKN